MKTITFYNEKGGVCKSTLSILYASWLKYRHGVNSAIVDFNNSIQSHRNQETEIKKALGIYERFENKDKWPIYTYLDEYTMKIKNELKTRTPKASWMEKIIQNKSNETDVLIVDFPGMPHSGYNEIPMVECFKAKMIKMAVIMLERDFSTLRTAYITYNVIKALNQTYGGKCEMLGLINKANPAVSFKKYEKIAEEFNKNGIRVLPDMITASSRVENMEAEKIITSTLEYPDWDSPEFKGGRDLGYDNLFIDITRLLDRTEDYASKEVTTRKTDLSFAHSLKKEFQEKRQLRHTAFPEFEFDESMFPIRRRDDK